MNLPFFTRLRGAIAILLMGALTPAAVAETGGGALLELGEYRGQVVVVDFWASWCVPCRRSFPWLNAMHAKYGDRGLVIIGVNLDNDREAADRFLEEYPADFRIVFDPEAGLAREYDVIAMPSSLVFGRSGELRNHHNGFRVKLEDEYEAAIVAALEGT